MDTHTSNESTFSNDPVLADQVDLEKEWDSSHPDLEGGPVIRTVTAQDWTGPDDPENPHNWSLGKRIYHTIPPGLFGFIVTFGSSVYTPANEEIAKHFNVSPTVALLGVTLYVIGLGFGPMLSAPASETFGRLIVYRVSLPISLLFTLGAGFSRTFYSLMICRFFAGFAGSPVLAVGAGTNADLFPPKYRAVATSSFLLAPFLGPSLGPFLGGWVAQYKDWRWTQWTSLFIGLGVYIISLPMKETYKKTILQQRAQRLGIEPPHMPGPRSGWATVQFLVTVTLFRPVHMLVAEPIVGFLSLYNAFTFSILFAFFEAFPIVFGGVYGFSISQVGLAFLAVGLGVALGVVGAIAIDQVIYQKLHKQAIAEGRTIVAPEHRLYAAMFGSIGIPVGLFIFAWTSRHNISAALYLVDTYGPLNGASAIAANGLLRYGMSSVFPLFTVQMYKKMHIDWATTFLALMSMLMLPIPWVLFKWGARIRAKSHYDTIKA
ncbi:hypothetical protein EG328_007271 [Venturia inaequalis]|uniref:Major facilitator superfamily (MFS) profile domain-containing protein n=1 Tax=Venturia inaequalis TaxID=5025 RepID=A0A8H3UEZ2_VENIN|nr:hypothetical protein EG328_007271 [Venturia inaequalis]